MTALTITDNPCAAISNELRGLVEDALTFSTASRAEGTVRQYTSQFSSFERFCASHALNALPADVRSVAVFLSHLAKEGKAVSTIVSHLAAVKYFHARQRLAFNTDDPVLSEILAGIRRTVGTAQKGSDALLPEDLVLLVDACANSTAGLRDRALTLVGFAGAFRRSEIAALTVDDVKWVEQGMVLTVRRSKTDQTGAGAEVPIPYGSSLKTCPVYALRAWIQAANITSGPLFRRVDKHGNIGTAAISEDGIRLVVTTLAAKAGLDGKITPHSLRAGFCTAASLAGAQIERIAKQARHASINTTQRYVRVAEQFKDHAGAGLL